MIPLKPLIFNLKMNHTLKEMIQYKKKLEDNPYSKLIVCPSFCFIPLMHSRKFKLGAQDVSAYMSGNNTGGVSAKSLNSLDVTYALIGHSETKTSYENKANKLKEALKNNIKPFMIISDTESDFNYQYTSTKLLGQIRGYLSQVRKCDYENITFIYEPTWLVGESHPLPLEDVENIIIFMKQDLEKEYHIDFPIYYGGGLHKGNILPFYRSKAIDGLLLGSSIFDIDNAIELLNKVQDSTK